jgi:IclR family pca regulon transcriptional regulator
MDDETGADPRSRTFVTAFARGLDVIQAFGEGARRLTLSDVAARAGVDRAVARRLLLTLVEQGFASSDGKYFELTGQVLRLGFSYLAAAGLDRRVQPVLEALSQQVGENTALTGLDSPNIGIVARAVAPDRPFRYALKTTTRMPATATASGRVLLAGMEDARMEALLASAPIPRFTPHTLLELPALAAAIRQCRAEGYAVVDGELEDGFASAAVPLRDRGGRLVAALATSSHAGRMTAARMRSDIIPLMREAAREMGSLLI